jgi:hypothetical protein
VKGGNALCVVVVRGAIYLKGRGPFIGREAVK